MYFYVLFFKKLTFIVTIKSYICHTQYLYDHLNILLNHVFVVYLVLLSSLMGPLQNVLHPSHVMFMLFCFFYVNTTTKQNHLLIYLL